MINPQTNERTVDEKEWQYPCIDNKSMGNLDIEQNLHKFLKLRANHSCKQHGNQQ